MKGILLFIAFSSLLVRTQGQNQYTDSLLKLLPNSKDDKEKVNLLFELGNNLESPDSSILFAEQGIKLAQLLEDKKGEASCKALVAIMNWTQGDFPTAIKLGYSALEYFLEIKDTSNATGAYAAITNSYRDQGDYKEALNVLEAQKTMAYARQNCTGCGIFNAAIGSNYYGIKNFDSALFYLHKGLSYKESFGEGWILLVIGKTHEALKNDSQALGYYHQSIEILSKATYTKDLAGAYSCLGNFFLKKGQIDSSLKYGQQALLIARRKKATKSKVKTLKMNITRCKPV